ncbi:MAG: nucleoside hydrolase [Paracoccus sp. (in: a-proteobacteria)]|uniref:nucleoside hydrolase n=1 Tax=Paracoccus sp. TaxID=267 RepID=UPI0039E511FE
MKILIDTDPGIDDAMAIIFAARHPEIEILGLTTVFGNVPVQTATLNALALVEHCGLDIPVAEGAARPLELPPMDFPTHIHGENGFGHLPPMQPDRQAAPENAAQFMTRLAREMPGQITLCPVGPITNVAEALKLDPEFATNLRGIVLMGGALDAPGNISPWAEANAWHDPHALQVVLRSGAKVTVIGLDVTMRTQMIARDFAELAEAAPHDGGLLDGMSGLYLDFYASVGHEGCALHDPMAVIACLHPELFRFEEAALECVLEGEQIGRTIRAPDQPQGRAHHQVALECDSARIKALFLDVIRDAARVQGPGSATA